MIKKRLPLISLIISFIAIALSQMRPLYTLFDKPNIDIVLPRKIQIDQYYGYIMPITFCQIRNVGQATGRIVKIEGFITFPPKHAYQERLLAETYLESNPANPDRAKSYPFGNVILKPDQSWEKRITLQRPLPQADENKIVAFKQAIAAGDPTGSDSLERWVLETGKKIEVGEYWLLLLMWQDGETSPAIMHAFRFHLYEENLKSLREDMEHIVERATQGQRPGCQFCTWVDAVEITDGATIAQIRQMWQNFGDR